MKITEDGEYLLTKEEYKKLINNQRIGIDLGIKKKENIRVEISEHKTPKHLQDIENFLNSLNKRGRRRRRRR